MTKASNRVRAAHRELRKSCERSRGGYGEVPLAASLLNSAGKARGAQAARPTGREISRRRRKPAVISRAADHRSVGRGCRKAVKQGGIAVKIALRMISKGFFNTKMEGKTMKKTLALIMALCLVLGMGSLAAAEEKTFEIGILQLVQHPALDLATQGFRDALTEKLGDRVTFDEQNASGDSGNCTIIANSFVSKNVDLIMANATAALLACSNATADIPVLGTSITNYESAMEIELTEGGATGFNVSGTSDLAPLDGQAAMIKELFPEAKTVALMYCNAEPNSIFQIRSIEGYLTEMGYECKPYGFNDSNDLASVAQAATECDVIYIPTDNTAANNTEAVANVVLPAGVPVVAGEEGICAGCGVATLTISYYDIGYQTGLMAWEILENGANVAEMPIAYAPQFTKKYNAANAEALNVSIPEGYEAIAE